jgi:hypothetical protein
LSVQVALSGAEIGAVMVDGALAKVVVRVCQNGGSRSSQMSSCR